MAGENPQTTLPPVPREPIINARGGMSHQWERWIQQLQRVLSFAGGVAWGIINKAESKLSDIEARTHAMLQSIAGTGVNHVSATENAEITAIDGLAAGMVAKTADATYAARTIQGTDNEVDVGDGAGALGNPVISLPDRIIGPRKFGTATDYTEFEAGGTMVFNGAAKVWEDLNFDPDSSGGPPVTLPDYVTINNVIHREFTAANNQICGSNKEIPHAYALGTTMHPHMHVFLKGGESAGTTGAGFTFYWELRQSTGTTTGSVTLSATSAELTTGTHKINIYDATGFAGPAGKGANLAMTIARTAGDAGDVIVTTYGVHYQLDTVGSREMMTK